MNHSIGSRQQCGYGIAIDAARRTLSSESNQITTDAAAQVHNRLVRGKSRRLIGREQFIGRLLQALTGKEHLFRKRKLSTGSPAKLSLLNDQMRPLGAEI